MPLRRYTDSQIAMTVGLPLDAAQVAELLRLAPKGATVDVVNSKIVVVRSPDDTPSLFDKTTP